jgi:CheY-like chemotaxis protein
MTALPVMVIEDDVDIRESFAEVLGDEGYEVMLACNGREALELLAASPKLPGLFLVDMMMPVMDGLSFCARWKEDARLSSIPLLMISASSMFSEQARSSGATGFVVKPLGLDQLLDLVEKHVGKAK